MITNSSTTPVLFMVFNRPEYTRQVFEAIRTARPARLYISADGPRSPEETALCAEVRSIVDNGVDWPCEVHKNYAPHNMGLRDRISSGITWFFEHEEEGIILEDDCLPDESFFAFASMMLKLYRDDARIMMVSGSNPLTTFTLPYSYIFSKSFSVWGWATWRRAWQKYDIDMQDWEILKKGDWLTTLYTHKGARKFFTENFNHITSGTLNTWDIQWLYTCIRHSGLSIIPSRNLVSNIGRVGTHSSPGKNNNVPLSPLSLAHIQHPPVVDAYEPWDTAYFDQSYHAASVKQILNSAILKLLVRAKRIARKAGLVT